MPKRVPKFSSWDQQTHSAKDALGTRAAKVYAVKPMLVVPSLSVVYGHAGSHKTNLLIDMAVCVALGKKWLEGQNKQLNPGFDVVQSPIVWLDSDSGQEALDERFGAMLREHGGDPKSPIHYLSFPTPPFQANQEAAVKAIVKHTLRRKAKLLILDNLGTISGGQDENSSGMIAIMSNLRRISELTSAAVIVIHHEPKSDQPRKTPRGHSSIEAAVDLALWIKRDEETITMEPTKTRGAKFDAAGAEWWFEQNPTTLALEKARFYGIAPTLSPDAAKAQNAIITYLKTHINANQTQLVQECTQQRIGRPTALAEIQRLVSTHLIKEKKGQLKNATLYSL